MHNFIKCPSSLKVNHDNSNWCHARHGVDLVKQIVTQFTFSSIVVMVMVVTHPPCPRLQVRSIHLTTQRGNVTVQCPLSILSNRTVNFLINELLSMYICTIFIFINLHFIIMTFHHFLPEGQRPDGWLVCSKVWYYTRVGRNVTVSYSLLFVEAFHRIYVGKTFNKCSTVRHKFTLHVYRMLMTLLQLSAVSFGTIEC